MDVMTIVMSYKNLDITSDDSFTEWAKEFLPSVKNSALWIDMKTRSYYLADCCVRFTIYGPWNP